MKKNISEMPSLCKIYYSLNSNAKTHEGTEAQNGQAVVSPISGRLHTRSLPGFLLPRAGLRPWTQVPCLLAHGLCGPETQVPCLLSYGPTLSEKSLSL